MRPVQVEYIVPANQQGPPQRIPPPDEAVRRLPSFVAPVPPRQTPATVDAPAWLVQQRPLDVGAVWTPTDGARETTSAMDRARALQVRLVPWLAAWFLIALVVGVVTALAARQWPAGALVTVLLFAVLTAVTWTKANRTDYEYSREGTERHRLDTAADLTRQQMEHEHELRRMALQAYLESLDRHVGGK